MTFSVEQKVAMIAWVHNFRRWTWFTFAVGFVAAVCGLWSGGEQLLVGSGLGAMIGVALLIAARRWRHRGCGQTRPTSKSAESDPHGETDAVRSDTELAAPASVSAEGRVNEFVDTLMSEGRFALLLRPQIAANLGPNLLAHARQRLERQMTLVPEGNVLLEPHLSAGEPDNDAEAIAAQGVVVRVEAVFLDRYTVTNRQFQVFVTAGGYDQMAIWDPTIWPAVLDFVDATGHPGPRYWQHGRFPPGKADHPVVGVSWYEAAAYARWVGKRLPTDAEWLKAGCWPVQLSPESRLQRRFPWGNAMDRSRANLWGSGPGETVPVEEYATGVSVGGVGQLIGNVWEWTAADFELPAVSVRQFGVSRTATDDRIADYTSITPRVPLKALRGGAFDTYFDHHAACQSASGDNPLARKYNIGFRLALGVCDLAPPPPETEPETQQTPEVKSPAVEDTVLQPA